MRRRTVRGRVGLRERRNRAEAVPGVGVIQDTDQVLGLEEAVDQRQAGEGKWRSLGAQGNDGTGRPPSHDSSTSASNHRSFRTGLSNSSRTMQPFFHRKLTKFPTAQPITGPYATYFCRLPQPHVPSCPSRPMVPIMESQSSQTLEHSPSSLKVLS